MSPTKRITQQTIADRVGVDRTTVTKVLNGSSGTYIGDRKRLRILEIARELGYGAEHQRERKIPAPERRPLEIRARVQIVMWDGAVYSKGSAVITKLTAEVAVLTDFEVNPLNIPIKPCFVRLDFTLGGQGMHLRGDFNRMNFVRFPRVFVKFVEMLESDALHIARHAPRVGDDAE